MKKVPYRLRPVLLLLGFFLSVGCSEFDEVSDEENSSAFQKGKSYLKVGKNEDALDEFLSITRRMVRCPKSHLEVGRLYLTLKSRKDPVAAIYHFRRYLFLEPSSREAPQGEAVDCNCGKGNYSKPAGQALCRLSGRTDPAGRKSKIKEGGC